MGFFDDSDDELEANVADARRTEPPPPAPQQAPPPQPPPSALAPAAAPKSLHEILRIAREKEREMERARERAASEAAPAANRKGKRPAVAAPAASAPAAAAAASKRPRVVEVDGTLVVGDDSALPEAEHGHPAVVQAVELGVRMRTRIDMGNTRAGSGTVGVPAGHGSGALEPWMQK